MSPEAQSPAQAYITYYNSTLTAAGHGMSKSRPAFTEGICYAAFRNMFSNIMMLMEKNIRMQNDSTGLE